jgi:hypothetical protein
VDRVPGCADIVGEREEAACLSLRVVKEQYFGHDSRSTTRTCASTQSLERARRRDGHELTYSG